LMRNDLEDLDVNIKEALDVGRAMEIAMKETVSLVITDLDMPGENGLDLVSRLRKQSKHPEVPVIMVSVNSDYQTKVLALKMGVDSFITKPVKKKDLLDAVRSKVALP
ncbi:MAG: response regulator, partial [Nitrospinota bacterium]|nr:response regulator [Nitrospinota bacterium]